MAEEAVRCLPAKTNRRLSVGRLVRRASSCFRVEMEVVEGTESGITICLLAWRVLGFFWRWPGMGT